MGGNLSVNSLMNAYRQGVFPWFEDGQPIMWWSPSQRAIINTKHIHVGRNMKKLINQQRYKVTADNNFTEVMTECANLNSQRKATWITNSIQCAYQQLHQLGITHSIEVYDQENKLVGGLYGVFIGNCFCGESMFSRQSNTSKLALIALARFLYQHGCSIIDCQLPTKHLISMGAIMMPREKFIAELLTMSDNLSISRQCWTTLWLS